MDRITEKAWEVFRSAFRDGEDVVVEDEEGRFFYGTLKAMEEGILLTRTGTKAKFLEWDLVAFIAHDGFPVQPIMGMTSDEAIRRAKMEPTDIVREVLESYIEKPEVERVVEERTTIRRVGGGCPWEAEPIRLLEIHNRGNASPMYWRWPYDSLGEVMVFGSDDGAVMHSYDSEHLFLNF